MAQSRGQRHAASVPARSTVKLREDPQRGPGVANVRSHAAKCWSGRYAGELRTQTHVVGGVFPLPRPTRKQAILSYLLRSRGRAGVRTRTSVRVALQRTVGKCHGHELTATRAVLK